MSANSSYKTLLNIRNAIIKDAKESSSTTFVALVDRWINEGHEQVTLRKKRDWLDTRYSYQVNAAVEETAVVSSGSTTVTFTAGTTFPTGVELQFYAQEFEEIYEVSSATSNVITLAKPYLGSSNTAASCVVFQRSILLDTDIRAIYQLYHNFHGAPVEPLGPQEFRAEESARGPQLDYADKYTVFGQDSSSKRRLLLFPYPKVSYTLYVDCNTYVPVLSNNTDEPVIPMQYRQILYWYGMYKVWLYHRNDSQAANALAVFNSMLMKIDGETRSEIEFPAISVNYPRRQTLRRFTPPFDPRMRDS